MSHDQSGFGAGNAIISEQRAGMRIAIIGAGGLGHELIAPLRRQLQASGAMADVVFADDVDRLASLPVLRIEDLASDDQFIVSVGDGKTRELLHERAITAGLTPFPFCAPTSIQGIDVTIGNGGVLCDFVNITARVSIGRQFQANIYSYVAHDCVIGDYVTLAPQVCCNGNVHVADYAYIGTGAVIRQGTPDKPLRIGAHAVVGMGAVVTKDVPEGATVVGNPARPF